jgi:hypothetical protein
VSRGRLTPRALHLYTASIEDAVEQIKQSEFWEWDDIGYYGEVEGGREFLNARGTVVCSGGVRVHVYEKLMFHRERRWAPSGAERLLDLVEYSHSAVLHNRGNIFRYDSPDIRPTVGAPEHHKHHHLHRFDVLGTGEEIKPPEIIPPDRAPTLRQVLHEAEAWYRKHLESHQ